jgi:serine/threonine-protein kinase
MPGPELDHDVGRVLGRRYRLEARIGVGASAVVYRATDLNLRRAVAVKQLKPELSGDARFIKLFRSEAHLAGQLDHPNVLTVHDWSADDEGVDGGAYIVTEYLTGGTLRQLLDREGCLPVEEAAMIGLQVARGLRAAHGADLVHRDIKPGNILFGADGRIRIGDFGIARAVAVAAWTEPEGHLIGTARYAAPEQGLPGEVTGRSDVYSLAVCLVEMITGEVPLVGESGLATMVIRREQDLPVDDRLGELTDLVAWAGLAEWAVRPTADQVVEELSTIYGIQGPDPVATVDLTTSSLADAIEATEPSPNGGPVDGPTPIRGPAVGGPVAATGRPGRSGRRRRGWSIGLGVFVLAVVAALVVGWLVAGLDEGETEVVEAGLPSWPVPDFAGLTPEEARSAVDPFRWVVTVAERRADGTSAGELLEQRPEPGVVQGPGATVELVYSLGSELRTVPDLVGLSEDDARAALATARLSAGSVSRAADEEVASGVVLEATIAGSAAVPGAEYPTGTAVDLVVSDGPAPRVVPDVGGMTGDQARRAIEAVDLVVDLREEYSEAVPEGTVIGFSPTPGAELARGSTVTVTVSLGRPLLLVPDLAGRPILEAAAELGELGFEVRIEGATDAAVLGTRPPAGTSVRSGSGITIVSTKE